MPSCFDVALKVQKFSSYWSGFVLWQFCSLVNFQLIHFRSELEHFTLAHICRKHLDISTQSCSIHRGFFKKKNKKKPECSTGRAERLARPSFECTFLWKESLEQVWAECTTPDNALTMPSADRPLFSPSPPRASPPGHSHCVQLWKEIMNQTLFALVAHQSIPPNIISTLSLSATYRDVSAQKRPTSLSMPGWSQIIPHITTT